MGEQPPFSDEHKDWVQWRKGAGVYGEDKAMGDNWRTDEPEVGQFAWLKTGNGKRVFTCIVLTDTDTDPKCWFDGNGSWVNLKDGDNWREWLPITTPEERRLRDEVERLREENGKLKRLVGFFEKNKAGGTVLSFVDGTIETEAGGAG